MHPCRSLLCIACLLAASGVVSAQSAPAARFTVTNSLDLARPDEVLEIPLKDINAHAGQIKRDALQVRDPATGKILLTQLAGPDGPAKPDRLLVLADLAPRQTLTLEVTSGSAPATQPASRVFGRYVPERKDDFAWENDKVAFRIYGPRLQSLGEIGSGIDLWSKRTSALILDEWYHREAEAAKSGKEAVHTDAGTGLDCYKVGYGIFRGCGGTGVFKNGQLYVSQNWQSFKIVDQGPVRFSFDLIYAPWDADGVKVSEIKHISIEPGSRLTRLSSTFHFSGPETLTVAAGIQEHKGFTLHQPASNIISIWESADLDAQKQPQGMNAVGMILPPGEKPEFKETLGHALYLFTVKPEEPVTTYAGGGWSKYDMPDQPTWDKYLETFNARLAAPLTIRWNP